MCLKHGWCWKHKTSHRYGPDCDKDVPATRGVGSDEYICPHNFWSYSCSQCKEEEAAKSTPVLSSTDMSPEQLFGREGPGNREAQEGERL